MNDPNLDSPEVAQFEEDHLGVVPAWAKEPAPELTPEQMLVNRREAAARGKLRVAMATRDHNSAPKPTGVHFVSGKGDIKQAQMIFDDGSIRNPYRQSAELSGRQRRKMAKKANRQMRRMDSTALDIRDLFRGRQRVTSTPQEVTPATDPTGTSESTDAGTPVAE